MADIKSLQALAAEITTFVRSKNPSLDVSLNSLIQDIIFTPYAIGGKRIMDQVNVVKLLHILSELTDTDLDAEGTNYLLERLVGTYATVTLTLYARNKPTKTIVVDATSKVKTAGTVFASPVTFSIGNEFTFALSDMDAYYSHDRGRYEFQVTAVCDTIGSIGNIGAGLINTLISTIDQIDGVTNLTASQGGLGLEENDDFRERIRMAKLGRDLNVAYGLRKYLMGLGFRDANIVRVEQAGYERATGVDAFVIDSSTEAVSETFTYSYSTERYYFSNKPVLEVTSVTSGATGTLAVNQYNVNIDESSPLRRSILAQDYIEILPAASLTEGAQFTVSYNYSSAIKQAQDSINLPINEVLTADVLVKRAYVQYLFLNASLTLKANADGPTTRNKGRNALSQFLSRYKLGENVQQSDLTIVLQQGFGDYPIDTVDAVVISSFYLQSETGIQTVPVNNAIDLTNKQHALYGSAVIV